MAEKWKISGTYFEACNCEVACPCVFTNAPTEGDCQLLVGWHIEKGSLGQVALDGLNAALAVYSPGHMLQTKWQAALYLDEKANDAQKNALTQIFGGQVGGVIGGIMNSVPMAAPPPPPKVEAKPAAPQRLRVGGNVQSAKLINQPKPAYPPLARQARIAGMVRFNAIIGTDGRIQNLTLVSGHPLLVPAAQAAVSQWVYQPTTLNGEPVEVATTIDVNFTLQ